ncbi:MAG: NAD(P)/FAD-dependent oxidoreductase [Phycisphaerae bacterium]|nr:NAD(P)/FAD-dependent oxidoreductase [Phycisphaerae bacterium]
MIVGAGAAGLTTAIFAARRRSEAAVVLLDGARKLGAKILASGGGRCNVTNVRVTPADFCGGSPNTVRRVLDAFPVDQTVAFFREIGVTLHEEEDGKLFPDSNDAHTVLDALLAEARARGVRIVHPARVTDIVRDEAGFCLRVGEALWTAPRVVLATGGLSLPQTGSDGSGYTLARSLGHSLVPTTPALDPLVLEGDFHVPLAGIAHDVELAVAAEGSKPLRHAGALLWTHFGVSGPVVLDVSRHWHRASLENRRTTLTANLLPGHDFASVERALLARTESQPRTFLHNALASLIPARLADAILAHIHLDGQIPMAHLTKPDRRRLTRALHDWPLPVIGGRGYDHAEVTAGGVPLDEVDPATLASRPCPGLYLAGEILDVDGRIGGFNFQWAWSSAHVAAQAL